MQLSKKSANHNRIFGAMLLAATSSFLLLVPTSAEAKKLAQKDLLSAASGFSRPIAQADQVDGNAMVEKWLTASKDLKDYTFNFTMTVFKASGDKVTEKGTLYFKQPRLLRIEITGGPKNGSVAVLMKDGTVKGHMGGALKFLNVSLSPDSSYLLSANGWPMVKSDYVSLAEAVQQYIKEGCIGKISASPVAVDGYPNKLYDWSLYKNGVIYKRALFEPSSNLPVEWWDYTNGKVYAHSVWTNFKSNTGLSDKTFTMKGDK
jgi:outer membrane lipoprotein-sorting protein